MPPDWTSSVIQLHCDSIFITLQELPLIYQREEKKKKEKEIKTREHFVFLVRCACEGISLSGAENPYQYDKVPPVIPDDSKYQG